MTMAGKAAEIMRYGEDNVSNGPAGDIQQASGLARAMVLRWGMSGRSAMSITSRPMRATWATPPAASRFRPTPRS